MCSLYRSTNLLSSKYNSIDVRHMVLLHLLLEDAPYVLNCVQVWRHTWPLHHLQQQDGCHLGGVFGVVMLENSFWREGIIFCFRMSQYMLESMFPSMNHSSTVPAVLMQPKHFTVFCIYITHCCILMYALNCFYLMFCVLLYVICLEKHCSILPETNLSSGTNKVYQKTMILPPPCLTVGKVHFSWYSSPGHRHTCWTPSESNKFTLDSSDHRTWFQ